MKQMLIVLTCLSVLLGACARNYTHGANTAEQSMDTNGASIAIVPGLLEMPPSAMPAIEVLDKTIYAKPVTDLPLEAELFGPFPETFVNLSTTTQNTVVIGEDGTCGYGNASVLCKGIMSTILFLNELEVLQTGHRYH